MQKDLRSFIRQLELEGPDEWLRITKKVSPKYEATAILFKLESQSRYPAVYFENINGFSMPAITNLHATRKRLALALEVPENELIEEYKRRENARVAPVIAREGPVKEMIHLGTDVDLGRFPLFTHFDINTAPYITAGIVVTRDPLSRVRNLSFNRGMLVGKNRLHMHLAPGMHLARCQRNAEDKDEPLEV
ncbi:MAG: UbiD family decarboxylase domain-containing protein, partial [Candidatus Binatia bacterium]